MKISLRIGLWIISVGLVLLTSASLGGLTYWIAKEVLRENIRTRMANIIAVAVLQIDPELHSQIRSREDEESPAYLTMKRQLQKIRDTSKDIRFLYTCRLNAAGEVVFVVDAEESAKDVSHVGDVYEEATPTMRRAFSIFKDVVVEEGFNTDRWGTFLSSYVPFYSRDGKLEGVLGMDLSAEQVIAHEQQYLNLIAYIVVWFCLISMLVGILFSRRIALALSLLEQDLLRIQNFDLESGIVAHSVIKEVDRMQDAVRNMKMGLRSFKKYVPADLVAELIQLRQEAVLGAESRSVTIFFSDIAGFTTISERLTPDELSRQLGIYFEAMTRTILNQNGTVDKFIGDAVMAFWGAPKPREDHALLACRAAVRCQRALKTLAGEWERQGLPAFSTRIGVCTGEALIGNMGYSERMSYTALGDVVNLTSRLEGLNKFYGTRIVIGDATRVLVEKEMATRCLGVVAVKGKQQGVRIHELVEEREVVPAEVLDFLRLFDQGMDLYFARAWDEALVCFRHCLERNPHDVPAGMMITQCQELLASPPGEVWDGVIVMHEK